MKTGAPTPAAAGGSSSPLDRLLDATGVKEDDATGVIDKVMWSLLMVFVMGSFLGNMPYLLSQEGQARAAAASTAVSGQITSRQVGTSTPPPSRPPFLLVLAIVYNVISHVGSRVLRVCRRGVLKPRSTVEGGVIQRTPNVVCDPETTN